MLIRLIKEKDYEEVSALIIRTLREVNIRDYPKEYIENDVCLLQPANIKERSTWTHFYVACDGEKIVGCGAIGVRLTKAAYSRSLFCLNIMGKVLGKRSSKHLKKMNSSFVQNALKYQHL